MIARFDHRPMLTALLALTTTVLLVVVITLTALLITAPPAASPTSGSGSSAAHAQAQSGLGPGSPARDARGSYSSNGNDPIERHAEVVQRLGGGSLR